jgi:hypothetical protein
MARATQPPECGTLPAEKLPVKEVQLHDPYCQIPIMPRVQYSLGKT